MVARTGGPQIVRSGNTEKTDKNDDSPSHSLYKNMSTDDPIEFIEKTEACFVCPESLLQKVLDFLAAEQITVLKTEQTGDDSYGPSYALSVSDVSYAESKELVARFKASLHMES